MPDSSPFYMTRQLANTMEELARRCRTQSAVFYISGMEGVGKSRLVKRFLETRSQTQEGVIFSAAPGGVFAEQDAGTVDIERIYHSMKEKDLVFVDQAEQIDCQQILNLANSWKRFSLDGKVCLLVLVGRAENHCVRELSSVLNSGQLFELKLRPLNIDESRGFLRFRLGIVDDLQFELTSRQRSSLKRANGRFDELIHLSDNLAGTVATKRSAGKLMNAYLAGGFLILVLLTGVHFIPLLLEKPKPTEIAIHETGQDVGSKNLQLDNNTEEESKRSEPVAILLSTNDAGLVELQSAVMKDGAIDQEDSFEEGLQPVSPGAGDATEKTQIDFTMVQNGDLLAQRLQATADLMARSSDKTGTIQLITLAMAELKWEPIVDYLYQLQRAQIDLNKVFIYKTEQDMQFIVGVLYGEFIDSAVARTKILELPDKLKESGPFPRSIKGVKKEIYGS